MKAKLNKETVKSLLPKLNEVKYRISTGEAIGFLMDCELIIAYEIFASGGIALLYFPPWIKYWNEDSKKHMTCKGGCGSLSFGQWDYEDNLYYKGEDYLNILTNSENIEFIKKFI